MNRRRDYLPVPIPPDAIPDPIQRPRELSIACILVVHVVLILNVW